MLGAARRSRTTAILVMARDCKTFLGRQAGAGTRPRPWSGYLPRARDTQSRQRARTSLPWPREYERRVHSICGGVERRLAKGQNLAKAVRRFARYWRGRYYKAE